MEQVLTISGNKAMLFYNDNDKTVILSKILFYYIDMIPQYKYLYEETTDGGIIYHKRFISECEYKEYMEYYKRNQDSV